jgi:nucleoside-diphosphate-sugar epimerase
MRILVTGAAGFIGCTLIARLLQHGLKGRAVDEVVASDLSLDALPCDPRLTPMPGSIANDGVLARALERPVDLVFHLASVPGGAAERDPLLGRRVNLDATMELVELLRAQGSSPQLVFASTVAVYGEPLPARVDDDTAARPVMSYAAHKLAAEIMLTDASRRGWIRACSVRLPGVVARPGDGAGLVSAYMSQLFWRLRAGEPITLPVEPQGMSWWISVHACVDNLLLAATLDAGAPDARRVVQMPALHLSTQDVVAALVRRYGADRASLVRYEPQDAVQRLFASYPPLKTPAADALGFRHDGTVDALVRRSTAD